MNKPPTLASKALNLIWPGCTRLEDHYEPQEISSATAFVTAAGISNYPRITIVVPSYNQGRFIEQTFKSIIDQGYPNLELIVIDGGSSDETLGVIKQYAKHITWWVSEADDGQANAINKGMSHATGEILAWLNSDDCLMPGSLLQVAQHFLASPDTDVVYGHRVLINEAGLDVGRWILPAHRKMILTYADYIPQETMFWRKILWRKVNAHLDESFRFAMDWELICRFVQADAKFTLIPAFLGQFRMHAMQKTNANLESDGFREMAIIRKAYRQSFSRHAALQILYHRMQRASLYGFVVRARLTELLWQAKLIKID